MTGATLTRSIKLGDAYRAIRERFSDRGDNQAAATELADTELMVAVQSVFFRRSGCASGLQRKIGKERGALCHTGGPGYPHLEGVGIFALIVHRGQRVDW